MKHKSMARPITPEQADKDSSEDLAEWLQEVGRRRIGPKEPDEALRIHLEHVAGRAIRTRQDISEYVEELSAKAADRRTKTQQVKNVLLGALLVIATLQYYFIEVQLEILAQPALTVFAPSPDLRRPLPGQRS